MSQAGTNLGLDIEGIAKYPSDFLGNKNSCHNVTIVTGTFRSDTRFFSKLFDLEIKYPLNLIYLCASLFQIYPSILEIIMV